MSTEETRSFIGRYLEALSGKEKPAQVVDRYIADSDQALKEHIRAAEADFPCYEFIADTLVVEGNLAAVRARLVATHKATGKPVNSPFMIFYRLEDGKIAEHWMIMDNETLMKQLGAAAA